jgi:hypothetical protein
MESKRKGLAAKGIIDSDEIHMERKSKPSAAAEDAFGNNTVMKVALAKTGPSVVKVKRGESLDSGVVVAVDGDSAIVATNYHVMEGAKELSIVVPADDGTLKNECEADGYVGIMPERDLALVYLKLTGKKEEGRAARVSRGGAGAGRCVVQPQVDSWATEQGHCRRCFDHSYRERACRSDGSTGQGYLSEEDGLHPGCHVDPARHADVVRQQWRAIGQ